MNLNLVGVTNVVHLIQFQEYYKSVIEVLKGVIEGGRRDHVY